MSINWYQWPSVEKKLIVFGKSFLGPHAFGIRLEDRDLACSTAYCDFNVPELVVNPCAFGSTPQEQYMAARGLLIHEVGHARYTTPHEGLSPVVHQVSNILEDERIERIMAEQFYSVRPALLALTRHAFKEARQSVERREIGFPEDDPGWVALYMLQHRWAVRLGQTVPIELSDLNRRRWEQVKPLVEEAWGAADSRRVDQIAVQIVETLGLSERLPEQHLGHFDDVIGSRGDPAERSPGNGKSSAWNDGDCPRLPDDRLPAPTAGQEGSRSIRLGPPGPLLEQAGPHAARLIDLLELPELESAPEWSDRYGRLSVRAAIRTRDRMPFVMRVDPEPDARSFAIGVLLDCSGSMSGAKFVAAQVAAAMLHLTCAELDIWHSVVAFEGATQVVNSDTHSELCLARLAGLWPGTGSRVGPSYRALLDQMAARPEPTRILLVIHDGEPDDATQVTALNREAADRRIEVFGIALALDPNESRRMRSLFGRAYIECSSPDLLAVKLAAILNTLRR